MAIISNFQAPSSTNKLDAVLKVGGSLVAAADVRRLVAAWSELATRYRLLLLPGGGPFADTVRAVDAQVRLSDSAAHWMAILAMDQFAHLLADLHPNAELVSRLEDAEHAAAAGRLPVLAPSRLLQQLDPLPHRWDVTSDSIAAWLAGQANIPHLVLLKSVPGIAADDGDLRRQVSLEALRETDLVDAFFGQALRPPTRCWLIDGRRPERLAILLATGQTIGTEVVRDL